jgi:chromosome segregation ATPase
MSVSLEKLDSVISDLEEQTQEIGQYRDVIQRISNVELQIEKTTELSKKSAENLSVTLEDYTDFISNLESKLESQDSLLKAMKNDMKNKISEFSHEFIEKVSVMRDEYLNAHIDIRQDIERVNKANKDINESINQVSEKISAYSDKNSKEQEERHQVLETLLLEQNKKLSINNKVILFIATITSVLLPLCLYFILK